MTIAENPKRRSEAPKPRRVRRSPEAARAAALESARRLLLEQGPEALTLPAVARDLGMTHGNLTHHFGSVSALHAALIAQMAHDLGAVMEAAAPAFREGRIGARAMAQTVFRAFDEGGAGRLIAWLAATGRMEGLAPMFLALERIVARLREGERHPVDPAARGAGVMVAALVTSALGAALIGAPLQAAAGLAADALEGLAAEALDHRRATPAGETA